MLMTDVLFACLTLPSPPKMSKSVDTRLNWIRDRARQNLFRARFVSGSLNRADFMTKALPVHTRASLVPYFASRSPPSAL